MKILIHIQIPAEGLSLFLQYEELVLPLLEKHGCTLLARHQSQTGEEEFHIIECPTPEHLKNYRQDAQRLAVQHLWDQSEATARVVELT